MRCCYGSGLYQKIDIELKNKPYFNSIHTVKSVQGKDKLTKFPFLTRSIASVFVNTPGSDLKWPSHGKLKLTNRCW